MHATQVLSELETLGNAARRKHNTKAGAGDNQFGVKLGDVRKLAKRLKKQPELWRELWDTGNVEARLVATLIVRVKDLTAEDLGHMVETTTFSQVADWLSAYVLKKHSDKEALRQRWMKPGEKNRWAARAGWSLTAERVAKDAQGLDLSGLLRRIENQLATAPSEVQWTMNMCLVNIGIHHPEHRKRALDIGEKLGVYSDYPVSKGCTSPFAPSWINEMVRRQG